MKDVTPDEKKARPVPLPVVAPGELTCTEGQVEDLLSEGESTEAEPVRHTEHMTRGRKRK